MKQLLLFLFAIAAISVAAIPVFLFQVITQGKRLDFLYMIAVALDRLGAVLLYKKLGWTVSSVTYYKRVETHKRKFVMFEKFINFIFRDKHHCRRAYVSEMRNRKVSNRQMALDEMAV